SGPHRTLEVEVVRQQRPCLLDLAPAERLVIPLYNLCCAHDLLRAISSSDAPGAEAVLARLADAMLTQALRIGLAELAAEHPERASALRDPHIARAVHLIHREPEERWTVDRLAASAGYSRSGFAAGFRELVGEAPMAYVARTRLVRAAMLLRAAGPHARAGRAAHRLRERVLVQPCRQARLRHF